MGIVSRVSDIIAANLHGLLDRAEDPEAMLAHVIREMEDGLSRARRLAAVAIAAERGLRRERDDHHARADHWKGRAREALAAGQEELARRALARKQDHDALARGLDEQCAEAARANQSARAALHALEVRLVDVCGRQRSLLARHRVAQVRVEMHRQMGVGLADYGASQTWFDRLTRRADELAAEAELHESATLDADIADAERRRAIDRELEELKREC
jgi:phage shock protein A